MNGLQIFTYQDTPLRTIEKNGEIWWVLRDVCNVLQINNTADVAARLDDDEKGVAVIDTPGGKQEMLIINEPGLYNAIFRSAKAEANEKYFALVTSPQKTETSIEAWTLFTADETAVVLDGIISGGMMDPAKYIRDGLDVNYLGKLAAHGYYPDNSEEAANPAPAPALEIVEDGTDFPQFSLLPM